jgi:hypothetical protein
MPRNEILRFYRNMERSKLEILMLEAVEIERYYQFQQKRVLKKVKRLFLGK